MSFSLPTVPLYFSRFHFRLNGGFTAAFRWNAYGFSAPSPLPPLRRSHRSLPTVSHSLPTEWRRWCGLSTELIWLLCFLSFSFSLFVSICLTCLVRGRRDRIERSAANQSVNGTISRTINRGSRTIRTIEASELRSTRRQPLKSHQVGC